MPSSRLQQLLHYWPALLVALCCAAMLNVVSQLRQGEAVAREEEQVRQSLALARSQLDAVIEATFSVTGSLETLLRVQGGMSAKDFQAATEPLFKGQSALRSVVAAPNDVAQFVYPLLGNEKVQGLHYHTVPIQLAQIQRARQLRTALVFAPVQLVQGGVGVVQRRPVFLGAPGGEASYWGTVTAVADLDRFMARAGVPSIPIALSVMQVRADGQLGQVIWGTTRKGQRTLREDLFLPGATWAVVGHPREGWSSPTPSSAWLGAGLLLSVLLTGASAMLTHRRLELARRSAALEIEVTSRRASQAEAESAKARLQSLVNSASDWLWEQNADLQLSFISHQRDAALNEQFQRGSLGHRRWEQPYLVPGAPDQAEWDAHRQCLESRLAFRNFEYALQAPGRPLIWLSISGEPRFGADGEFLGYRGTARDVSKVRGAEAALRASALAVTEARDRLQAVLDASIEVAIIATDLRGCITLFNRGAERMLGYAPSEVLGQSPRLFNDEAELQARADVLTRQLGRAISLEEVFTLIPNELGLETRSWTFVRRDGGRIPVSISVSPLHDDKGQVIGHLGLAVDQSAERRAQDKLETSLHRMEAVFDSAIEVLIVVTDVEGRISNMNRGAELILGVSAGASVGQSAYRLHWQPELMAAAEKLGVKPWEVLERQSLGLDEGHTRLWTVVRATDGAHRKLSHTSRRLLNAQGQQVGYVAIGRDVTDELESRRAVDEERKRMQSVLDASLEVAIIAINLQGRITLYNGGAERMLGYSTEEMMGRSPALLHVLEEVQARAETIGKELGRPINGFEVLAVQAERPDTKPWTWTYLHKDGHKLTVTQALSCIRDAQGAVQGYLGIMIDVSEQHAAAQRLQEMNAKLQAMLDTSELAIVLSDLEGRTLAFNKGAERLTGYSAAEVLGKLQLPLLEPEELRQRQQAFVREHGREPAPFELFARQARQPAGFRTKVWTYRHRSGRGLKLSLSMSEVRDGNGQLLGYLGQGRDIGPELAQQRALKAVSDRLQAVLDGSVDVGILVVDSQGRVTLFNRGAEHLFGYAQHEMLGRSTLERLHERSELEQRREALSQRLGRRALLSEIFLHPLTESSGGFTQWTLVRKGGERFQGSLRLSLLPEMEGEPESYLAIVLDMSEQVQARTALEQLNTELEARVKARTAELSSTLSTLSMAQEELMRADKLAALGAMVAGVAHELNTPIGTCLTAASTLEERAAEVLKGFESQQLRRSSLEGFLKETAQISRLLLRGLGNASNLVTHFKQLSVDQTGEQRRSFHLGEVLGDVLTVLRPQLKQSRIVVDSALNLQETIDGYPGEMGRLLANLILNAQLHAFEPGTEGRVLIQATPLEPGWFELRVQDNGMGMTAAVKRRAFDPFFTTKLGRGGSGLGLNIVYNIATAVLGGTVELRSEPGAGTCFVFRLPICAPQLQAGSASAMQPTQISGP